MSNEQGRNQFEVKLNVPNFHANDLQVNVHGRELIVSGHHEEREEGNGGIVERHFVRTYMLPKSAKEKQLVSELSADGVLKITVPTDEIAEYRKIPIKVDPNWKMRTNPCQELIVREPIPLWWW
ncbi:Hsp20/alpha crystallin family protein [Acanthocheilonema viteae]